MVLKVNKINFLLNLENHKKYICIISVTSTNRRTITRSPDLEIIEQPSRYLINTPQTTIADMSFKALQEMRGWQQSPMNRPDIPGKYDNTTDIVSIHA